MNRLIRIAVLGSLAVVCARAPGASEFAVDASRVGNPAIRYRDAARLSEFPVPVVAVRRVGLSAGAGEAAEIREKILYPLIERSRKAIAAIVLEWYPGQPDGLGVIVVWSDGQTRESMIPRTSAGTYRAGAHELLLAKPTP